MLRLILDLHLGPGRAPLPDHLGGVLHGFVEGGVKNHAPHLLPVLRPQGANDAARFTIQTPPFGSAVTDHLRFGVTLHGTTAGAWPVLLSALLEQQANGLQGRIALIAQAACQFPDGETHSVLDAGQLVELPAGRPVCRNLEALAVDCTPRVPASGLHRLAFHSPLLLASRKAQREPGRRTAGLPWPTLASVLDSIAQRLFALEPELAEAIGLPPAWAAPEAAQCIAPFTPAATPARQVQWQYTATPRTKDDHAETPLPARRTLQFAGIVGDLLYPVGAIEHASALLHWGQWLGIGQKTTMGCGGYVLGDRSTLCPP